MNFTSVFVTKTFSGWYLIHDREFNQIKIRSLPLVLIRRQVVTSYQDILWRNEEPETHFFALCQLSTLPYQIRLIETAWINVHFPLSRAAWSGSSSYVIRSLWMTCGRRWTERKCSAVNPWVFYDSWHLRGFQAWCSFRTARGTSCSCPYPHRSLRTTRGISWRWRCLRSKDELD